MRPKRLVLIVTVLVAFSGARGAELSDQRLACQQESRRHILGPRLVDPELYHRVIERRHVYVQACMINGLRDVEQTGSFPAPLPPKRPAR